MQYATQCTQLNKMVIPALAARNVGEIPSFPEMMTITTTLNCNYRCRMCYQSSYGKEEIPWSLVEKIVPALPFVESLQIFGGEPLLYSRFDELVRLCGACDTRPSVITNGTLLDANRCALMADNAFGLVKVSIDAGTAETYREIRGGNFQKVMGNIATLAQARDRAGAALPRIEMNFVVMKSNVREIGRLATIGAAIGVDQINVYYMCAANEQSALDSVYFCQEYSDEQILKGLESARHAGIAINIPHLFSQQGAIQEIRDQPVCHDPWKYLLVGMDGNCTVCCGGFKGVGNLNEAGFQDVWNGKELQQLRRTVNTDRELPACRSCRGRKQKSDGIRTHFSSQELYLAAAAKLGVDTGLQAPPPVPAMEAG